MSEFQCNFIWVCAIGFIFGGAMWIHTGLALLLLGVVLLVGVAAYEIQEGRI